MKNEMSRSQPFPWRRRVIAGLSLGGMALWFYTAWLSDTAASGGAGRYVSGMAGRLGLMMGALWLAWPSLRRPASWLPPGAVALVIGGIAMVAIRPRALAFVLPLLVVVIGLGWVVGWMRGSPHPK